MERFAVKKLLQKYCMAVDLIFTISITFRFEMTIKRLYRRFTRYA